MQLRYATFDTPLGPLLAVASERGLRRLSYQPAQTLDGLRQQGFELTEDAEALSPAVQQLQHYFAGQRVRFNLLLDRPDVPEFRRRVWQMCLRIPYGQTVSYAQLAAQAGRPGAARAVGSAMAQNPLPIVVPCHRVLGAGGRLGQYNGPEGVKARLLALEKAAQ